MWTSVPVLTIVDVMDVEWTPAALWHHRMPGFSFNCACQRTTRPSEVLITNLLLHDFSIYFDGFRPGMRAPLMNPIA